MDVNDLQKFILIIIISGMLLAVGLVSFYRFGDAIKDSSKVAGEAITIASASGSLANDDVTDITDFYNSTRELTLDLTKTDWNFTSEGAFYVNDSTSYPDGSYLINYTYKTDSVGTDAMDSLTDASSPIGSVWIPLIITIAALAIVLGLVIKSFGGQR